MNDNQKKPTGPPWEWYAGTRGDVHLGTPDRTHLIVLDFVRLGMQGAQPRFADWPGEERQRMGGVMKPASEINIFQHPDARLIAAAPSYHEAAHTLAMLILQSDEYHKSPDVREAVDAILDIRLRVGVKS